MRKLFLPVVIIALAFAACTKEKANESGGTGTTTPTDSTSTGTTGSDSVVTFTGLNFALAPGSGTYGRVFSSFTGKVYLDNAIPDTIGKYIDLAFNYLGAPVMYFSSANEQGFDLTISGATTTLVRNYVPADTFAVAAFDTLSHAKTLSKLYITNDDNSFGSTNLPVLVFFKNSYGKKGIIKVTSLASDHLVADVKVQY